jgi:hypothetical protein
MKNRLTYFLLMGCVSLISTFSIYGESGCDNDFDGTNGYEDDQKIHLFQDEFDGVDVMDEDCWYASLPETDCQFARRNHFKGIWLPECPPAFRPFLADPRQLTYSVGWRVHDKIISQNVIDFSFGDILPVYRWINIGCFGGDLQFDVEGGVWDVFAPFEKDSPMVNADYYCGFPVTYIFENWAIRLRGYHISCHLGDEYMVNHPRCKRKNPSAEFLDLFVSNQYSEEIRLYAGIGWVCLQDESFECSPWYAEGGAEIRMPQLGYRSYRNRLYGEPFFGMHFRYQEIFKHHVDSTYVLGWEWGKFSGLRHKLRVFLEYHDGYSLEGQFCKQPTNYLSIRASYGY